jgi:Hemerythrin HHE cation binding domain
VKNIIDNLSRQHRELLKAATKMFGWLDVGKLAAGSGEAFRCLSTLTGILRVHLAMEDRSFYPGLLQHRDEALRAMARKFLDERAELEKRYDRYRERWSSGAAILADREGFVSDTREVLGVLWQRMHDEDDRFHPEIIARWTEQAN